MYNNCEVLRMNIKRWIPYIIFLVISVPILIFFLISPVNDDIVMSVENSDGNNVYITQPITMLANKPINEWYTTTSLILVILGLTITGTEYIRSKSLKEQEKASEIAKMFSDKIAINLTIINHVMLLSEFGTIIKKSNTDNSHTYDITECSNFDRQEIRRIYGEDIFQKHSDALMSDNMKAIYALVLKNFTTPNYSLKDIKSKITIAKDENKPLEIESLLDEEYKFINNLFPKKFDHLILTTLNELEYLCMYITSKSADSQFIYQSLHQIFLRTIRILAITIAGNNINSCDKYYTNIIQVYNDWVRRYKEEEKQEKTNLKRVNEILNPKLKTVK